MNYFVLEGLIVAFLNIPKLFFKIISFIIRREGKERISFFFFFNNFGGILILEEQKSGKWIV